MRNSDYENVRVNFMKLYGSEKWMKKREIRWSQKTEQRKDIDRKLFYALAEPEKFQNDLYTYMGYNDRKNFKNLPKNLSDAKNLLKNGATNDFIFKHQDKWGYCFCWTSLDISVARGFDEITDLILQKHPEEIHKKDEYFHSPLFFGFLFEREKSWEKLENYGAQNLMISWALGNVRGNKDKGVWNYLKVKFGSFANEIENCFKNIRDRSLMTYWTVSGITVLVKFIEEDFGPNFIEKIFDWNGKNNPIFYPIRRKNQKLIFLGSILKEAGINGKVDLQKYDFGIIANSNKSDQKFTILINENAEFPDFVETGKLAITLENGRIYVSLQNLLKISF